MSSDPTRSGWLAPLATAALFAFVVASPTACAKALERTGGLGANDGDESEQSPGTGGTGGAGGIDGYQGPTATHGAGGAPATGPGAGGDPASSVAASSAVSSTSASSAAASVAASSAAASVAASSSSGGGPGPCCVADIFPGCFDDLAIESCVCSDDDYCCTFEWDDLCVEEVESLGCGTCS
ncbi:MAG: hypothetical protein WKG00_39625 [Polyangiaceae bacterium]